MAVKRLSNLRVQYEDGNGIPLSGGRLFFYAAGTATKLNTFTDSGGLTPNSNPIVLNASGEPSTEIWLTTGAMYKLGLAVPGVDDPPASFLWIEDSISPINDATITIDQWIPGPTPTFVSATSFSLVGDQTQIFTTDRRVRTINTGGTVYGTVTQSIFSAGSTTVTVLNDSGAIDAGISAVFYGILSSVNPSVPIAALPRGQLSGLTLANNATATKLDVTSGKARDSTDTANIVLASSITAGLIQLGGAWAAGNTQNKLDTGVRANNTWYHVFAIRKDVDGSGDWLFSLSTNAPTMPAGYTKFRRIGSVRTDGAGNITAFKQLGDEFLWSVMVQDVGAAAVGNGVATLRTITVPTGIQVLARCRVSYQNANVAQPCLVTSPDESDQASPNGRTDFVAQVANTSIGQSLILRTNTSAQLRDRGSGAGGLIDYQTFGWIDSRGRLD